MISPSAVGVSADLADAALGSPALMRAYSLARWLGPGRELTPAGVLRPGAVAEACWALGISQPAAHLPGAPDVDELMQDWATAVDAGFVVIGGGRAQAAPDLAAPSEPEAVLNGWMRAAARALGVPGQPCAGCLTVVHALYAADGPLGMEDLADAMAAVEPGVPDGKPCLDCGCFHDPADLLRIGALADPAPGRHGIREDAGDVVTRLAALGALTDPDGAVRLTPLGSMLAAAVFEGCAPAPDAGAATVMSAISEVPPPVAAALARPWLAARPADVAAAELLTLAAWACGEQRAAALAFATELGPAAAPAWREWAGCPGFGAYARRWLADQGEATAQDPADEAWLTVDALSIMLAALPGVEPAPLLDAVRQLDADDAVPEALSLLRDCGHPAAASVVARLTGQPEPAPGPPGVPGPLAAETSWHPRF